MARQARHEMEWGRRVRQARDVEGRFGDGRRTWQPEGGSGDAERGDATAAAGDEEEETWKRVGTRTRPRAQMRREAAKAQQQVSGGERGGVGERKEPKPTPAAAAAPPWALDFGQSSACVARAATCSEARSQL